MKKILEKIMAEQAIYNVNKHKPIIVALTGSYGKTTTKDALVGVISQIMPRNEWRASQKSFNNELGIPLTILGYDAPGRSLIAWIKILLGGWFISRKNFPKLFILEIGADHPGDIKFWAERLRPDIAVLTGVSTVHAEFYNSVEQITDEKLNLGIFAKNTVIVNASDLVLASRLPDLKGKALITYGFEGDLRIENISIRCRYDDSFEAEELLTQTVGSVIVEDAEIGELVLDNSLGYASLLSSLAALGVVLRLQEMKKYSGKNLFAHELVRVLRERYKPTPGRMRPLAGIKGSLIIDDSYNAAPAAVKYGLSVLASIPLARQESRRIAVLGDMAELGQYSEKEHKNIAGIAIESADLIVLVGEKMKMAFEEILYKGFNPDNLKWFKASIEAGRFLDSEIRKGDVVYIKGSQSTRMEKVVKDVMAEPLKSKDLLVRQEDKWLKI
jgi:UDP-N-acetylmuramoyl-tripeptide--D-alanyl-D-alanine ligase